MQTWACDLGDNNPSTVSPADAASGHLLLPELGQARVDHGWDEQHRLLQREDSRLRQRDPDARSDSMITTASTSLNDDLPDLPGHESADRHAADSRPGRKLGDGRNVLHAVQPRFDTEQGNLCRAGLCQQQHGQHADAGSPLEPPPGRRELLFGDGSVKFIKNSVSLQTWRALGTRNGGEVISADAY